MYCKRVKDKFELCVKRFLLCDFNKKFTSSKLFCCHEYTVVSACLMTLKFNGEIPTEVGVLGSSSSQRIFFI